MIKYHCNNCDIDTESSECSICKKRTEVTSKLYWCYHCNIPTYDEVCPACGNKGEYFTSDARPVFPEERLLIEIMLGKPLAYIEDSVWNGSGNRYYVNGKKIKLAMSKLAEYDIVFIIEQLKRYQPENNYTAFSNMIERWIQANAQRYHSITTEAKRYIDDFSYRYLREDKCAGFVSFSGGKDSTVVSDLVRKSLGNPSIIHIFGDTTLEFPYTEEYVKRFRAANRKTPVLIAKNTEQDFYNLCETFGPPSQLLRWCCTIFKTGFIGDKIKKTFDDRAILSFYGIRRSESTSRNTYERASLGKKISKQIVASPIIDWFDYDIWLYLLTTKIDFNEAYRLGFTRVGCWCCPNNSHWSRFLSAIYMPEETKRFHDMLYNFAIKTGKSNPEDYIASGGWKARKGGAGMELSKNVVIDFKPCATDAMSFNYVLNKPITKELYEFFKPFGKLNFEMGKTRLGEVYILDCQKGTPIMKLQGRLGTDELRITILDRPIAKREKTVEIELKFKCQITKYQLCMGCHACESVCRYDAIKLLKRGTADNDYQYQIDEKKCEHCFECINHYDGGCYMRRVLLPRGKGYSKNE